MNFTRLSTSRCVFVACLLIDVQPGVTLGSLNPRVLASCVCCSSSSMRRWRNNARHSEFERCLQASRATMVLHSKLLSPGKGYACLFFGDSHVTLLLMTLRSLQALELNSRASDTDLRESW